MLINVWAVCSSLLFASILMNVDTPTNVRQHAEGILNGTIAPSDDMATFACMDSITSENAETRTFYFEVMRVIVKKADGALAEMVGVKLHHYFENYTLLFLNNYKILTTEERTIFVNFIAWEYVISSGNDDAAMQQAVNFINAIENNCPDCKNFKRELKDVKAKLFAEIDNQRKNE